MIHDFMFNVYFMLFKVETLCLLQVTLPSKFAYVSCTIWSELSLIFLNLGPGMALIVFKFDL